MPPRGSTIGILNTLLSKSNLSMWQVLSLVYHFPSFVKLYWRLYTDKRVPFFPAKAVLAGAFLYLCWPADLLPEAIFAMFGLVDDALISLYAVKKFIHLCPQDIVREHVEAINAERRGFKPSSDTSDA